MTVKYTKTIILFSGGARGPQTGRAGAHSLRIQKRSALLASTAPPTCALRAPRARDHESAQLGACCRNRRCYAAAAAFGPWVAAAAAELLAKATSIVDVPHL